MKLFKPKKQEPLVIEDAPKGFVYKKTKIIGEKNNMNKNYENPSIEIIVFDDEIKTGASVVIEYPWDNDNDGSGYFE